MASLSPDEIILAAKHLQAAKFCTLGGFSMFIYDIFLTFPLEVEKVWKRRVTGLTILWFLNRWIYGFAYIFVVVGLFDPDWNCQKNFRYPGILATCQRIVIGSVFVLRTYAIYGRGLIASGTIVAFLITEVTVKLYVCYKYGSAVTMPKGLVACFLAVEPQHSIQFSWFYITELMTDFVVLVLTVYCSCLGYLRAKKAGVRSRLWRVILKDGIIYFLFIFSTNLVSAIFFLVMTKDLKPIVSTFTVMFNSLLTARLILNLKTIDTCEPYRENFATSRIETVIMGDIGNDYESELSQTGMQFVSYHSDITSDNETVMTVPDDDPREPTESMYEMHSRGLVGNNVISLQKT